MSLKKVTLKKGEKEETWEIEETTTQGDTLLIRFAGIDSPEAAANLGGAEIIARRESAAPLKEGEYYVGDLNSLKVVGMDGKIFGEIISIVEGGGGNLAEVKQISGIKCFVPFRKEFFGDVNLEEGKIVLLEPWILE